MTWWQILTPLLLDLIKAWLDRRPPRPAGAAAPMGAATALMTDAQADALATRFEQALAQAPKTAAGGPATHEGGIIAHITDLIAALRARDWPRVQTLVIDLLTHL